MTPIKLVNVRRFVYISLAVVVVAFAATWMEIPAYGSPVPPPAKFFAIGIGEHTCAVYEGLGCKTFSSDIAVTSYQMRGFKERIIVAYASLALLVVLIGLAFRKPRPAAGLSPARE